MVGGDPHQKTGAPSRLESVSAFHFGEHRFRSACIRPREPDAARKYPPEPADLAAQCSASD